MERFVSGASSARSISALSSIPILSGAQIQSAIIFGAAAALYGEVTLNDGRV